MKLYRTTILQRLFKEKGKPVCSQCPYMYKPHVSAIGPAPRSFLSGLLILGEAPGEQEETQGEPFVGSAGKLLSHMLTLAGLDRSACWITNVLPARPEGNNIQSEDARRACKLCSSGLKEEIQTIVSFGASAILALGQTAMDACGVQGPITYRRGYVYPSVFGIPVIPSFHPAYLLRGNQAEIPTCISDIQKAYRIAKSGWKPPEFSLNLFPSIKDIREFTEYCTKKKPLLGVDTETTSLIPEKGEIVVVGLAYSTTEAISIPFLSKKYTPYWKAQEEAEVRKLLKTILSVCPVAFHNAVFDVSFLRQKGFPVLNIQEDTILLAHTIHPEQYSRLAFVASLYDDVPYWKNTLEDKETAMMNLEDEDLRMYNAKDAIEVLRILPRMLQVAESMDVLNVYRTIAVPLIKPIIELQEKGIYLSTPRLKEWKKNLQKKLSQLDKELRETFHLPQAFNPNSGIHIAWLLYGIKPSAIERSLQELQRYKKKNPTLFESENLAGIPKKYHEIRKLEALYNPDLPFYLPKSAPKQKTSTGQPSTDETAIRNILIWVRTNAPKKYQNKNLDKFLELFLQYRETAKLISTYGDFTTWKDNRVHFPYRITGSASGRIISGDKKSLGVGNAQNIPDSARCLFIAPIGRIIIGADYTSLEPRMLAYLSNDEPLIRDFENGVKIYDSIIRDTVGIPPTDPQYSALRSSVKVYVLATNYGASLKTAYRNMQLTCPGNPITYEMLEQIHKKRLEAHPAYAKYLEELKQTVLETRTLRNAFGRTRTFLGQDPESVLREALNYGPQSSGADLVNQAMIRIHNALKQHNLDAFLILQVHDALYIESRLHNAKQAARILQEEMERPVTIGSYKDIVFPVELKAGASWGELVKVSRWQDIPSNKSELVSLISQEGLALPDEWEFPEFPTTHKKLKRRLP